MKLLINLLKTIGYVLLVVLFVLTIVTVACSIARSDSYGDAQNAAKDAFLAQSGLQDMQNKTTDYLKHTYIDPYWWSKDLGAVAGGGYYAYRHHNVRIPLTHDCKLTVSTSSIGIEYHW